MNSVSERLFEYLSQRYIPQDVNQKHKGSFNFQDRIALGITSGIGTMYAVYFIVIFLAGWMIWQTRFHNQPFDPYPFAFLLFLGNVVQLLLMPLIMVGQNIQGRHAEIRAAEEYKTTNSTYKDIEKILTHLDKQDRELLLQSQMLKDLVEKIPKKN